MFGVVNEFLIWRIGLSILIFQAFSIPDTASGVVETFVYSLFWKSYEALKFTLWSEMLGYWPLKWMFPRIATLQ
jgi:hypothetical protein